MCKHAWMHVCADVYGCMHAASPVLQSDSAKSWRCVLDPKEIQRVLAESLQLLPAPLHLCLPGKRTSKILVSITPELVWLSALHALFQKHVHRLKLPCSKYDLSIIFDTKLHFS